MLRRSMASAFVMENVYSVFVGPRAWTARTFPRPIGQEEERRVSAI